MSDMLPPLKSYDFEVRSFFSISSMFNMNRPSFWYGSSSFGCHLVRPNTQIKVPVLIPVHLYSFKTGKDESVFPFSNWISCSRMEYSSSRYIVTGMSFPRFPLEPSA